MHSPAIAQFDGLARHYDWMEALLAGRKLERCRGVFLKEIAPPHDILLVGEGHGKFLVQVVRAFPEAAITCLDASAAMLEVARRRLKADEAARVNFRHGDLLGAALAEYDLIATHFFLDCLPSDQLAMAVPKLAGSLRPGGRWMVADFQIPASGWRRGRAQIIHWLMYRFFRLATRLPAEKITKPAPFLEKSGLVCEKRAEFDWGLLHAELWRKE